MPKSKGKKGAKKDAYSRVTAAALLSAFKKEDMLPLVARFCKMKIDDAATLRSLARVVMDKALAADRDQRKAIAVLSRRLHDRLPRHGPHSFESDSM
jgi:hypothetical protein